MTSRKCKSSPKVSPKLPILRPYRSAWGLFCWLTSFRLMKSDVLLNCSHRQKCFSKVTPRNPVQTEDCFRDLLIHATWIAQYRSIQRKGMALFRAPHRAQVRLSYVCARLTSSFNGQDCRTLSLQVGALRRPCLTFTIHKFLLFVARAMVS